MANVVLVTLLLAVALQVGAGTAWPWPRTWAWPWASDACAEPGTVREGLRGAVSVCVAGEGWRHVFTQKHNATLRTDPDCTGLPGQLVCDTTCSSLGVCLSNGTWLSTGSCASGQICLEGQCVEPGNATCPSLDTIDCLVDGQYPSLTDCSKYYQCYASYSPSVVIEIPCPIANTVFDACSEHCDTELPPSGECSWAISNPCTQPGTIGLAPNNDRMYYVCAQGSSGLYILWSKCTTGHFNLTTLLCDNVTEPGCQPDDPTTPSPTTTEAPIICPSPGVNENPSTNCSFYYCYNDGSYVLVPCSKGYYFDPSVGGCVLGLCT